MDRPAARTALTPDHTLAKQRLVAEKTKHAMRRFFIDPSQIRNDHATITDQEARHLSTVLRLKPGSRLELFDGSGMVYQAEITGLGKSTVEVALLGSQQHRERPPFISLAQGVVKGKKMDLIIQKATELGVSELLPIICQYGAVPDTAAGQVGRWQRIALEACKQCGRPTPMPCHASQPLPQLLSQAAATTHKIICWEGEAQATLADLDLRTAERVLLLIGPEGGFSRPEAEAAVASGFQPVTLGPRILRAETAAIAAMSIVQFLLGNLNRD